LLDPKQRGVLIDDCLKSLYPHRDKFDAIAVSGYSMSLIAPVVADTMNKGLIIVRKEKESRASQYQAEGLVCDKYIIIDDLICGGDTLNRVQQSIAFWHHSPAKLYGVYLYMLGMSSVKSNLAINEQYGTILLNSPENIKKQLAAQVPTR